MEKIRIVTDIVPDSVKANILKRSNHTCECRHTLHSAGQCIIHINKGSNFITDRKNDNILTENNVVVFCASCTQGHHYSQLKLPV
jgi:hypothetical protein